MYDADGRIVIRSWDAQDDGVIDFVDTYEWDEDGRLTRQSQNQDADAELEYDYQVTYTETGEVAYSMLANNGGWDATGYTYDTHGRELTSTVDVGDDARPDALTQTRYPSEGRAEKDMNYDANDTYEYAAVYTQTCP